MTKKWDQYKEEILRLYLEEGKSLRDVIKIMKQKHNFVASVRAYRARFIKWDVRKYNTKRRNSTNTVDTRISSSSPSMDDGHSGPAIPSGTHPHMLTRLYSSPQLGQASGNLMAIEPSASRMTFTLGSRTSRELYMPMDAELQSSSNSMSSGSPDTAFTQLTLPYDPTAGHEYENGHRGFNSYHSQQVSTSPNMSHWRTDTPIYNYQYGTQLHDLLKFPSWWLNLSTVAMIIYELRSTDVNIQSGLGESPLFLLLSSLQAQIHPAQVDILLCLLEAPSFSLRSQSPDLYGPLGNIFEKTLNSKHVLLENEDMANTLCKCLCKLLDLDADPNITVRGAPMAHHFLQDPVHMMAYTTFWPVLDKLCAVTSPTLYDAYGHTVLQCALAYRDAADTTNPPVLPRMRSAIALLLKRSKDYGALEHRNQLGRTALQVLADYWKADEEFWSMSRDFVWAGASTGEIVPRNFAADLHELAKSRGARAEGLQRYVRGDVPLSVVIWLSACGQRPHEASREHISAMKTCVDVSGLNFQLMESLLKGRRS